MQQSYPRWVELITINPFKPRVIVTVSAAGEDHIVIVPGVLWGRGVGEGQAADNLYVSFTTMASLSFDEKLLKVLEMFYI